MKAKDFLFKVSILAFVLALPLIGATNANLSDIEASTGNVFTAAALNFSLSSSGVFSPDVKPAQSSIRSISVINDGSLGFEYTVQVDSLSGTLCSNLNLTANLDGSDVYSSLLQNFNYNVGEFVDPDDWVFTIDLNSSDSGLQDQTCTFDFVFNGSQIAGSGFSDQETISNSVDSGDWTAPETTLSVPGSVWEINEKVTNGNFESGLTGWQTEGEVNLITASDGYETPYSGSNMVRIGHLVDDGNLVWENKLRQEIDSGAKNLSFYYNFYSFDSLGFDEPGIMVRLNDYNVFWLSAGDLTSGSPGFSGWNQFSFDLRGISDPVLEIIFYSGNTFDRQNQSWVYIDNVSTAEAVITNSTQLNLTADDSGGSGIAYTQYRFNVLDDWTTGISFTGSDLPWDAGLVYFRSVDTAGNTETTKSRRLVKDIVAPNAINDLQASTISKNTITLDWIAPSDGAGKAVVYDICYSTSDITDDTDFNNADPVPNPPAPKMPGELESFEVTGLDSDTEYWFAIKAGDSVPNWSSLSNVVSATTDSEVFDPFVNPGDVVINELMWMGTSISTADEYLELRNMTDGEIDISNWQITKWVSGTHEELMLTIPASTTIPAHGYFLIANFAKSSSKIDVDPDLIDISLDLEDSELQIKLYDDVWDGAGVLIDTADNAEGSPAAGSYDAGSIYYSMERNDTSGNGEDASSWHTCLASEADLNAYWDAGFVEKGTPGGPNLSYRPDQGQSLDFFLRDDKKAVGFRVERTADYESLKYEIVYDTQDGDKGIVSNIEINGKDNISRENLILGTCSGVEGKVCYYDQGITEISLKITLIKQTGEEKILEKVIDY